MKERQKEFLKKFAELCREYKPDFYYTTCDDGIHIVVDGERVFCGFSVVSEELEKAISA